MIRSLSPYYISTPLVSALSGLTCTSYTLNIFVWDGDEFSPPSSPSYSLTKKNPTNSNGDDKINISRLISDFIDFTPQSASNTSAINGNNQKWLRTFVTYETTDPNDATTPQEDNTTPFALGYSYGNEPENKTDDAGQLMLEYIDYKVNRNGVFVVGYNVEEGGNTAAIIKSHPSNEIDLIVQLESFDNSSELINYIWIDLSETTSDKFVNINIDGEYVFDLLIEDECRYDPLDVFFINKYGVEQVVTFFKERRDGMNVTRQEFESDRGQPSDGNHQFVTFNVQGRSRILANTGWVDEDMNEVFRQMFLSERLWYYKDDSFTPLNIKSKNIQYKTRQNERLISYEVEFEASYNEINSI